MFVGDKGKILGRLPRREVRDSSPSRRCASTAPPKATPPPTPARRGRTASGVSLAAWVAAARGGKPTYGDFPLAGPISDAFTLAAVSLRLGGRRLLFDAASARVTNVPEANAHLTRKYRSGWELPLA